MLELYGRDVSKLRKIDERHKELTVGGQQQTPCLVIRVTSNFERTLFGLRGFIGLLLDKKACSLPVKLALESC